ncbi:IPT/TIG domain-containing protein [Rufibacter immobilis]|uniref:IPT/TIG domain-containing protein n=1 Tax=Rufibacter immobilis TaxID=1348778 RepID=UPI0035E7E7D6
MKHRFTRLFSYFLKNRLAVLLLAFNLMGWLSATSAQGQEVCLLLPLSLEERVQAAEVVVEGKVVSQRSFWDDKHENIYTAHQVEVYKVFKGTPGTSTVEVITEGGRVDLDLHVYSATLQLKPQQQGIFFLNPSKGKSTEKRYTVFGSMQGFIKYQLSEGTAQDPFARYSSIPLQVYGSITRLSGRAARTVKANVELEKALQPKESTMNQRRLTPAISSFSPASLRAGTGEVLTIRGNNFGNTRGNGFVEFRNADDGGATFIKPLPTDYVSWTNTEIRVKVPTAGEDNGTAGSGVIRVTNNDPSTATSETQLNIVFAHSNVQYENADRNITLQSYPVRMISKNAEGGYNFRFGASFEANKPALHAFKRAMNEWSCATFVNWNTIPNAPVATTADDNINSVRFVNNGDLPERVLGRTISRYAGCISTTNNTLDWAVDEIDMEYASNFNWQFGPGTPSNQQFDFQSVVVHELGHAHQLSHLILPRAVMHYAVARGQVSRELNASNDIAGGNYVMELSQRPTICDYNLMEPRPANACAIPVILIELEATLTANNQVQLQWTTEAEDGFTQFVVERSPDGITYTEIGRVAASGTTTSPSSYEFTDPAPLASLNYYRLRVLKDNGQTEFSNVVQVTGPQFVRQLAPNPGGSQTSLYFDSPVADRLQLTVYDLSGRLHASLTVDVAPASNRYDLTLPVAGQGLFLIRWQSSRESGTFRYIKVDKL